MSRWSDVYSQRLNDSYFEYFEKRYHPFLDLIRKSLIGKRHELTHHVEFGCGMGNTTRAIIRNGNARSYLCLDADPEMLKLAKQNLLGTHAQLRRADVQNTGQVLPFKASLIHSHGLLEHFKDEEIRNIVRNGWMMGAEIQIHYVPGELYETPSFGDERLMSAEKWIDILKCTAGKKLRVHKFNDNHDYAIELHS
jgi:SAM-dependent methyltransferase